MTYGSTILYSFVIPDMGSLGISNGIPYRRKTQRQAAWDLAEDGLTILIDELCSVSQL